MAVDFMAPQTTVRIRNTTDKAVSVGREVIEPKGTVAVRGPIKPVPIQPPTVPTLVLELDDEDDT